MLILHVVVHPKTFPERPSPWDMGRRMKLYLGEVYVFENFYESGCDFVPLVALAIDLNRGYSLVQANNLALHDLAYVLLNKKGHADLIFSCD
mgnify:CR=1 FL=1